MNNSELYHHGRDGQKWGKRNGPPYPLKPGQFSPAEKKLATKREKGMLSEKQKEKVISKGDVKTAKKKFEQFSDEEIQRVIERYKLNKKLTDIPKGKIDKGEQKYRELLSKAEKTGNVLQKTVFAGEQMVKGINIVLALKNAFGSGKQRNLINLPGVTGGGGGGKNKNKQKQNQRR